MALKLSTEVRNARLDALENEIGVSPVLKVFSGAPPADTSSPNTGTVLATINLPSDWMADASSGQKVLSGSWTDSSADATGTAGHFRIFNTGETLCHIQGTITTTGGGGDMEVDNSSFNSGQTFTVSSFTLVEGNA